MNILILNDTEVHSQEIHVSNYDFHRHFFLTPVNCHMTLTNCKIKQFFTLPSVDVPLLHCNPIKGTEYVAFIF